MALVARTEAELAAVAGELRRGGAVVLAVPADLTSPEDRHRVVETASRELGPIDVLVNNAGGDPQREFHLLNGSFRS